MQDLMGEMTLKRNLLNLALDQAKKRGVELAQKECAYKRANANFLLEQKTKGTAITLIRELALGDKLVSQLRLERDIAVVMYDSAKEATLSYKLELRLIEAQIEREWNSGGRE